MAYFDGHASGIAHYAHQGGINAANGIRNLRSATSGVLDALKMRKGQQIEDRRINEKAARDQSQFDARLAHDSQMAADKRSHDFALNEQANKDRADFLRGLWDQSNKNRYDAQIKQLQAEIESMRQAAAGVQPGPQPITPSPHVNADPATNFQILPDGYLFGGALSNYDEPVSGGMRDY